MLIAFLILVALAAGLIIWGVVVSNGPGPADQRLGGAYLVAIGGIFGALAALVGFAKLVAMAVT